MWARTGARRIERARGAAALLAFVAIARLAFAAGPIDITERVKARPDLVGKLEAACARWCRGNRREAALRRVTALPLGGDRFRIEGEASLRSRHVQLVPAGLGGLLGPEVTFFDHTVLVRGRGTLDAASCRLRVEAVTLEGDRLGLGRLLESAVGRSERIERCRELLPKSNRP
ncbi:MAG: hypothetical protein N2038_03000 [Geminicoccaceae bacterium]|nr:hypothetical protein [Geminicoccaceae bacterium]MCX7629197.1 hypothetical protein [Geminicoccaceae bacterium]MDW8125525.1 hypothetical protein [Geminicoccaceae bacterium]MDW8341325.1 hypothetical protein [Geminicoccaceae bacterium]